MSQEKRIIKKYPNRRLYDMATSGYITVADVKQMIIDVNDVVVLDAKTGNDITRQVLLQILLEEEAGAHPLLSDDMLRQFICVYGQATQDVLGPFLAQNMSVFGQWQTSMHDQNQSQKDDVQQWFSTFMMPQVVKASWQGDVHVPSVRQNEPQLSKNTESG